MKLGFIGTGIITSSVVSGFCQAGIEDLTVTVSPRNKDRAAALRARFPENVRVAADNQEVVDSSDWIFIATLPKATEEIISGIKVPAEKKVISLVPTLSLSRAEEILGKREILCDVLPVTTAENRFGPVVCYPPVPEASELLGYIGAVVEAENPQQMAAFRTITGLMSAYYLLLTKIIDWAVESGVDEPSARRYVTEFTAALSKKASTYPAPLEELAREYTPGGLNWTCLTNMEEKDAYTPWLEKLSPILEKVKKD